MARGPARGTRTKENDDRQATLVLVPHGTSASPRDDWTLLAYPWFSLKPGWPELTFRDARLGVQIEISGGKRGVATIFDKEILIYIASVLNSMIEAGSPVTRTLVLNARQLLIWLQRDDGKKAYQELEAALDRLKATTIKTNIKSASRSATGAFSWIDNYYMVRETDSRGRERMKHLEIVLNEWSFAAICEERRVLAISRDYLGIRSPIGRRCYELARKHCGTQPQWDIGLANLAARVGTRGELREFKRALKEISENQSLPDYEVWLLNDASSQVGKAATAAGVRQRRSVTGKSGNEAVIVRFKRKATLSQGSHEMPAAITVS